MKLIKPASALVFLAALLTMQPALATLQYTYTTDVLPWQYSLLNGEDYGDEILGDGSSSPAFSFSFAIDDNELLSSGITTHIVQDADVTINPAFFGWYPRDLDVKSNGKVFLNADGSIASWNLIFALPEKVTPTMDLPRKLERYKLSLRSSGGSKTSNTDSLQLNVNAVTQRPHNSYIVAATIQVNYADVSSFDNWTIVKSGIPEPHAYAMMLFGLLSIPLLRTRRSRIK